MGLSKSSYLFFFSFAFFLSVDAACIVNTTFPYRLPLTVIPSAYHLDLIPNLDAFTFRGKISIEVNVLQSTSCVVVNALQLQIPKAEIKTSDGVNRVATKIDLDGVHSLAILHFDSVKTLPLGSASLVIEFSGLINQNNATGFFASPADSEVDHEALQMLLKEPKFANALFGHQGTKHLNSMEREQLMKVHKFNADRMMFATQFEAIYARTAFPCFDEPEFKSYWSANITVPYDQTALFNTRLLSTSLNIDGTFTYAFDRTLHPMANYLVAYAIGKFDYLEANQSDVQYRVYTPKGKADQGKFALDVVLKCTAAFEERFDFPYSRMNFKMDQIAVPAIIFDAMENWGLLTYYPGFLLVDPASYTTTQIQLVTQVICHELAHQWFGDTVTLPWWSQTYLNEGFARYLQYVGSIAVFPEWYVWTQGDSNSFFNFAYLPAMKTDSLGTAPAAVVPDSSISGTRDDAQGTFSIISYGKGASLNRMFQRYLGDKWDLALQIQLRDHQFTNPTAVDLINSFVKAGVDEATSKNILQWLQLPGFPVVKLSVDPSSGEVSISQSPISSYLPNPDSLWWIPLNIRTTDSVNGTTTEYSFTFSSETYNPNIAVDPQGITYANFNFSGYFLVTYDDNQWATLTEALATGSTPYDEYNKEIFVRTAFILTQLSHASIDVPIDIVAFFSLVFNGPEDSAIWVPILSGLSDIFVSSTQLDQWVPYRAILSNNFNQLANAVGWNSTADYSDIRPQILFWAVWLGTIEQIETALTIFQNSNSIADQIQKAVYTAEVIYDVDGWNQVFQIYSNASNDQKASILSSLIFAQNSDNCTSTLQAATSLQPLVYLGAATQMIRYNLVCQDVGWDFFQQEAEKLLASGAVSGSDLVPLLTNVFTTEDQYDSFANWLDAQSEYFTQQQSRTLDVSALVNIDFVTYNNNRN